MPAVGDLVTPENVGQLGVGTAAEFGWSIHKVVLTKVAENTWESEHGVSYDDVEVAEPDDVYPVHLVTVVGAS